LGIEIVETKEYTCERCAWKWVSRHNGKDRENDPIGCAKCKTDLWNIPRKNDMTYAAMVRAKYANPKYSEAKQWALKMQFYEIYDNRELYNQDKYTEKEMREFRNQIYDEMMDKS
jgi:hypothetical protein